MNEEENTTQAQSEETAKDNENRDNGTSSELIDRANSAAERLEKANKRAEQLLREKEEILARQALGGKTDAGQVPETKKISDADYAKRALEGNL